MLADPRLLPVQGIRSTIPGNPGINEFGDVIVLIIFVRFAVIGCMVPNVVANEVPFNVIAGVLIPPLAVKVPLNVGLANGANKANVVTNGVPFNVIVGVAIPPLAVNNPDMVAVPVSVKLVAIRPPRGAFVRLKFPLKIVESEK